MSSAEHSDRSFDPGGHLEQTADFDDTLVVDVRPGDDGALPRAWAAWKSGIEGAIRGWRSDEPLRDLDAAPDVWRGEVPVPATARPVLGDNAAVQLVVTPWR